MIEQTTAPAQDEEIAPVPEAPIDNVELGLDDPLGDVGEVITQDEPDVPMSNAQAEGVANIYNMAGVGTITAPITPTSVIQELTNPDITSEDIQFLMKEISGEDAAVKKQMMIDAIANPRLSVEQRLEMINNIDSFRPYDVNSVVRQALHNANYLTNNSDTDEGVEDNEAAAEYIEGISSDVEVETVEPMGREEMRSEYEKMLNDAFSQAEENTGWTDFPATLVPFRYQAPVMKIYRELGLDESLVNKGQNLLLGEALRRIRKHVESLDEKGKEKALNTVLRTLKPNAGLFKDGNDLVTTHVLSEIFYKDLYGKDIEEDFGILDKIASVPISGYAQMHIASGRGYKVRFNEAADNIGSVFDLVGVGSLAKATITFGAKFLPRTLMRLRKVSPEMANKTMADALENPAIAEQFDMSKADIVENFLPSAGPAIREGGVNGMGELISRQLDIRDRLLRVSETSNLTAAERADAFSEITQIYGDIAAKPSANLHLNESLIEQTANGARITAAFGRTKDKPFTSLKQALGAKKDNIEEVFGKDVPVEIVWRNPATNKLEPVPAGTAPTTKGEFFLQAVDERAYESAPSAFHSVIFGDKDVANLRFAPSAWKWLRGPSIFSRDVLDPISLSARQRTAWNKLSAGLIADVSSLNNKQSRLLAKVIKDGERAKTSTGRGTTYAPSELKQFGLDEKGIKAYYSFRTSTDIMYEVVNRQTRTKYLREGLMDVHGPKGRVGYAKPQRQQDVLKDIRTDLGRKDLDVYDAGTNSFIRMSAKQIDEAYANGEQLARLSTPMLGKGSNEATHVIVSTKRGTKALGLPKNVVTKIEGYYPHMWQGNFVVYGKTAGGSRVALGLASSEAEAKKVAAKFTATNARKKAAGKSVRFTEVGYDFDRSLSDLSQRGAMMEDMYINMGGPVYGHRNGGQLRNFSKAAGDILVDPIEALMRGMEIVGRNVTKGELAENMRQKLYNYARQNNLLRDPRVVPSSVEDLVGSAQNAKQFNKAKAYLEMIDVMLRTPDAVDQMVSKFYLSASNILSDLALKNVPGASALAGRVATKAAKGGDPMALLMGLNHRRTIASSPIAQAALQASQSLLMLGVAPVQYAKSVAQVTQFSTLVGLRTLGLHGSKRGVDNKLFTETAGTLAKTMGLEREELIKLVDTVLESGLVDAVGYHTQMRVAMRSAAEERMLANASAMNKGGVSRLAGNFARTADAATFGTMSRFGFEGGENINQLVTFLTFYNRDKAKGVAKLGDADYTRRLIGDVAEITGNMIPEMGFAYQRGWLKAAFQFVSFQHKMLLLTLPKSLGGSRSFTEAEKFGMVFAQFLLFGRRAAPHVDALYRAIDSQILALEGEEGEKNEIVAAWRHPATRAVMDGLIMDWSANQVIKALAGKDQPDYAIAERFAPGGGGEFLIERLMAIASNPPQAFFGMAGEALGVTQALGFSSNRSSSNLYKFFKKVYNVSLGQARDLDDVPLNERMEELMKEGGMNLFSTYNRYLATKAAEKMDGWVSSGGKLTEGYSGELEGALYTHFGITTKDREALYAAQGKYTEEKLVNPFSRSKSLDSLVDQYYRDMVLHGVKFDKEASSQDVWDSLMDKWTRERGLLFSMLPPEDAEYIRDAVNERLRKAATKPDSAESVLITRLTNDITAGRFGEKGPDVAAYLSNAEFVENNPRLKELVYKAWEQATEDGEE